MADALFVEPLVAVDTESNSLYAYRERVCLIQFSTPNSDYLVDPLALDDLTPLGPIFSHPGIEKIFHAAEYDVICLKRDYGFSFANLFDTMMAARILGRSEVGLGAILEIEFNVSLDKRYQRANWGQRPLPPDLLAYARLDTHFLIPLRHRLRAELKANDRLPLAAEDFGRVCSVNGRAPDNEPPVCWSISGAYDLTPQQAAILQELCRYRDQVARSYDRPVFKIIGNNTLVAIAATCPDNAGELKRLPGMTEGQVRRHGKAILQAVQRGSHAQPLYPPRSPRPSDQYLSRLEALRQWRKAAAQEMGVESDIVLPRDLLYLIAERNPRQPEELAAIMRDVPWRLERFGSQILSILDAG